MAPGANARVLRTRNTDTPCINTVNGNVQALTPDSMHADLKARTLQLLDKDPELLRALLERARLERYYNDLRARKFKNRWIVRD